MFPSNQYNSDVTVFTPYTNAETGNIRYFRRVLSRCFWRADSAAVLRAGGTAAPEQVEFNIPLITNTGYVNRNVWVDLPPDELGGIWTIRTGGELERSIIVRGVFEYPPLEQWANSEDLGLELRTFRREHGDAEYTPTNVSEYLFGPRSMHRVAATC